MKPARLEAFRQRLEALVNRVRSDAEVLLEQSRTGSGGNGGGELSNVPLHLGDMGTDAQLYDMNAALLENEQHIAREAHEAILRIDAGTYGQCEACGQLIAEARLEAIPYTRFCLRCAESSDATPQVNLNAGRPVGPSDTLAPEGEMQEDRQSKAADALSPPRRSPRRGDIYAAGVAGGGTAIGGLAGTNEGHGEPNVAELQEATGSSNFDAEEDRPLPNTPRGGHAGGAVGGTPARKRAK